MVHKGTKKLETKRLTLRRFCVDDAEDMFRNWANDSQVSKFLNWEPHGTIEVTKSLLEEWEKGYENLNCYNWAIVLHGCLVGSVSLLNPNDITCEAEAGYCMSRAYWGKGIMAEALSAVVKYAFEEVGFRRIFAKHDVNNPNSGKVMRKCGMRYIETKIAPFALDSTRTALCDCYDIINSPN